jgi:GNAT superfamily N-acetyltransferase
MPKSTPIRVRNTSVQLPENGPAVQPTIHQRCITRYDGFADLDSLYGYPPISHVIDLTISQDNSEVGPGAWWDNLVRTFAPDSSDGEERVRIASAQIDEFPARFIWDLKTSWFDWLDSMDVDLALVGELADELSELDDSPALICGSLLYIRAVDVHPAFAGQQIGARLLAHSLWSLSRCTGDVAVLFAKPVQGVFREGQPDCSAAAIRRLTGYYRRMGFERSRPRERFRDNDAVLMHARIGEFTLPFRGLGDLGSKG